MASLAGSEDVGMSATTLKITVEAAVTVKLPLNDIDEVPVAEVLPYWVPSYFTNLTLVRSPEVKAVPTPAPS